MMRGTVVNEQQVEGKTWLTYLQTQLLLGRMRLNLAFVVYFLLGEFACQVVITNQCSDYKEALCELKSLQIKIIYIHT